jgi:hypothetical protein
MTGKTGKSFFEIIYRINKIARTKPHTPFHPMILPKLPPCSPVNPENPVLLSKFLSKLQ